MRGRFYAGMKRLLAGDTTAARDDFRKCLATDRKDFDEYGFAAAELRLLERQSQSAAVPGRTEISGRRAAFKDS